MWIKLWPLKYRKSSNNSLLISNCVFLWKLSVFKASYPYSYLKDLFTLVIYLLELWEFTGFVPTKHHSTVTVLQRHARLPGQIKMFLNVWHVWSWWKFMNSLCQCCLSLNHQRKVSVKNFLKILLILKSFPSLAHGPYFSSLLFSSLIAKIKINKN